jgi:hypothetical protein
VAGSSEHGNEPLGCSVCGKFLTRSASVSLLRTLFHALGGRSSRNSLGHSGHIPDVMCVVFFMRL